VREVFSTDERQRLHDRIREHPGQAANHRWESLHRVHGVLIANERELLALIDRFQQDEEFALQFMGIGSDGRSRMEALFGELIRRTHNYLSALKMLVDHSRNLVRSYADHPVAAEYDRRKADVLASGRGPFLQKLRNYLIHCRIPPFGASMQLASASDTPRFLIFLDRDGALEFEDWPAKARQFLRGQPEQVPLRELIVGYAAELEHLYRWLYERFGELHGAEIDELNELIVQFQHNTRVIPTTDRRRSPPASYS
jgi:hypothetical protein